MSMLLPAVRDRRAFPHQWGSPCAIIKRACSNLAMKIVRTSIDQIPPLMLVMGFLFIAPAVAWGRVVEEGHVRATLISEVAVAEASSTFSMALRLEPLDGWHVYWRYSGDSGTAPKLKWSARGASLIEKERWPLPERIAVGHLVNFGYSEATLLIADFRPEPDAQTTSIMLDAEWLACKEECIPGGGMFEYSLPIVEGGTGEPSRDAQQFKDSRDLWPRALPALSPSATIEGSMVKLSFDQAFAAGANALNFFPTLPGQIVNAHPQRVESAGTRATLTTKVAPQSGNGNLTNLNGVLVVHRTGELPSAFVVDTPIQASALQASDVPPGKLNSSPQSTPIPEIGFGAALLFAFLGGLILNLMPCVFPVLSIKILGFVESSKKDARQIKLKGFAFAAGVVVSFWILAGGIFVLQEFGTRLGWGFQLQSPTVVAILALLLFAIGLNLLGLFEFGTFMQRAAGKVKNDESYTGSFLSGVLTTALATPCTAPFMGSAIGYALTLPPWQGMVIFTVLALGVALPYVVLCTHPAWLKILPRPGAWMETFKQFMAFPMFATMLWLLWVLSMQGGVEAVLKVLMGALVLLIGLWTLGRFAVPTRSLRTNRIASIVAASAVGGALWLGIPSAAMIQSFSQHSSATPESGSALHWEAFSPARLEELRKANRAVLLDFTAAWCVTCQVNKRLVFGSKVVVDALSARDITLLRADWTNQDEEIGKAIESYGRRGVPVNVLYFPDGTHAPYLFPSVLTPEMVLEQLESIPLRSNLNS